MTAAKLFGPILWLMMTNARCTVAFSSLLWTKTRLYWGHRTIITGKFHANSRPRRSRHAVAAAIRATQPDSTPYTLNDSVCRPTYDDNLRKVVTKHCATLDSFLTHKPIAAHTQEAFDQVRDLLRQQQLKQVVLDSGCGTGKSSLVLGKLYPNHVVIGLDRSLSRLQRNASFRHASQEEDEKAFWAAPNVILCRAECVDFWQLWMQPQNNSPEISHHYLLYPNPYPKPSRLKHRWYAHASFPLILQLNCESITVRSNWETYLEEFSKSVLMVNDYYGEKGKAYPNPAAPYVKSAQRGPVRRTVTDTTVAWTNFEQKYDDIGENTYELVLRQKKES